VRFVYLVFLFLTAYVNCHYTDHGAVVVNDRNTKKETFHHSRRSIKTMKSDGANITSIDDTITLG